jgi:uncharacterized delta-60 repeat protein
LNSDGTVDTTFTVPLLRSVTPPIVFNGTVFFPGATNVASIDALAVLSDGRLAAVGQFTRAGAATVSRLVVFNTDGSLGAFAPANIPDMEPTGLIPMPGGAVLVAGGGSFDASPGDTRTGRVPMVLLNPDGSRGSGFVAPLLSDLGLASANAYSVHRGPGGTFYAFLAAATPDFRARFEVMRFTAAGALDTTFNGTGRALVSYVIGQFSAVSPSGELYLGGQVTYRGTNLNSRLSRLTTAGEVDIAFTPNIGAFASPFVAVQPDGKLLVLNAGGSEPVVRLNVNGTRDTAYVNPATVPTAANMQALAVVAAPDGSAYLGGGLFVTTPTFTVRSGLIRVFGDPNTPPQVVTQPVSQTNTLGARVRFAVAATGAGPFTYAWRRNGAPIAGGTAAELVLPATTAADEGDYDCVVTSALGSTTSAPARLNLIEAAAGTVYRETDVPPGPGVSTGVAAAAVDSQGRVVVSGSFQRWNGINRNALVRLLPGGRDVDPAFDTSLLAQSQVNQFSLTSQDRPVFVGPGLPRGFVRLTPTGTLDAGWLAGINSASLIEGPVAEDASGRFLFFSDSWNNEGTLQSWIRVLANGQRDTSFPIYPANGYAAAFTGVSIAALPDGRWLVLGRPINSVSQDNGVIRLSADGVMDPTFQFTPLATPRQIVVQPDGRILVAATYARTQAGAAIGMPRNGVIRLLPDGRPDPDFSPAPQLADLGLEGFGAIRIALQDDGRILVMTQHSAATPPLARLWPNGVLDPEFELEPRALRPNSNRGFTTVVVESDNTIHLGGQFNVYGGLPRTNFVRINGGPLRTTPAAPTISDQPLRIRASAGTNLVLNVVPGGSGPFQFQWRRNRRAGSTEMLDIPGAHAAALTLTNAQVADSGLYQLMAINPGGHVITRPILVLIDPNPARPGQLDRSLAAGISIGSLPIAANPDGSFYAVTFGTGVRRVFEDGTQDTNYFVTEFVGNQLAYAFAGAMAVTRQTDGKLVLVGRLQGFNGIPCNQPGNDCFAPKVGIVRLLPDGRLDPDFAQTNTFAGFAQELPQCVLIQADGRILVGGTFNNFSGRTNSSGLARFLPDGLPDDSFVPGPIEAVLPQVVDVARIFTLQPAPNGRFYVGGGFNRIAGEARHGVARLNADGSLDRTFVPATTGAISVNGGGTNILYGVGPVTPEGGIYVFGNPPITRLNPDGSADTTFRTPSLNAQAVHGAVQPDGKLIISGQFGLVNGQATTLARLLVDGSLDTTFQAEEPMGGSMQILPDGNLLAGGRRYFTGTAAASAPPNVAFSLNGSSLRLSWPAGYRLQRATRLAPADWADVGGAASPFTVPMAGPGEYFRVVP